MVTKETTLKRRAHIHGGVTTGERFADKIAGAIGSWRFLIIQTLIVVLWCGLNAAGWLAWHWDPYPFILLNLLFSTQAAYTGPVLLLASNRQAQKDRLRDDRDDSEIGEILDIQHVQRDHDSWTRKELEAQRKDLTTIARVLREIHARAR